MNETFQTLTESVSTSWIEGLAMEELNMDESGIVNFNDHLNPAFHLESSSINYMNSLRDRFELYVERFNQYRGTRQGAQIRVFKISGTVNDFMLFRNSLRLLVSRKANDLISIGFLSNNGELYSARLFNSESQNQPHLLNANIGAFSNIKWQFNGEDIDVDALVKHYLSEFVRRSAK